MNIREDIEDEILKLGIGMSTVRKYETENSESEVLQTESQSQDLTKLTIKIALILLKNGVHEEKIEPITVSS